jgi:hypothetical protein
VEPVPLPRWIGFIRREHLELVHRHRRAAFGQESIGAELALEKDEVEQPVPAHPEFAPPERRVPVIDVEAGGLEIEARRLVFVAELARAVLIGREVGAHPAEHLRCERTVDQELDFPREITCFP